MTYPYVTTNSKPAPSPPPPPTPTPARSLTENVVDYAARAFSVSAEQLAADAETDRKAHRIALIATEQIDQLSLIGYPGLEPAYRDVVETTIFYAARGCLES